MSKYNVIIGLLLFSSHAYCFDSSYLSAFKQEQTKLYQQKDWEHFFGTAQAYRQFWWKYYPDPELVLLEGLALLQVCHTQEAQNLLKTLLAWSRDHEVDQELKNKLEKILQYIPIINERNGAFPTSKGGVIKKEKNIQRLKWPNTNISFAIDPHFYGSPIEDLCKK